jgi:hypothetical protein
VIAGAGVITVLKQWLQNWLPSLLGATGNFETIVFGLADGDGDGDGDGAGAAAPSPRGPVADPQEDGAGAHVEEDDRRRRRAAAVAHPAEGG